HILIAVAASEIVVKVLSARAHSSDVQGEVRLHSHTASIDIIARDHRYSRRNVEASKRLSILASGEAFIQRLAKHADSFRREENRQPAVGDLRRKRDVLRSDGRDVDRYLGAQRMNDKLERLSQPRPASHRDVVILTVIIQGSLAFENGSKNVDVLASPGEQLAVNDAVPAFDNLRPGSSYAQKEAPAGQQVDGRGGHCGHRRRSRRHLHDRRANVDSLSVRRKPNKRRYR